MYDICNVTWLILSNFKGIKPPSKDNRLNCGPPVYGLENKKYHKYKKKIRTRIYPDRQIRWILLLSNGAWNATIGFAVSLISEVAIFNAFYTKVRFLPRYHDVRVNIISNDANIAIQLYEQTID